MAISNADLIKRYVGKVVTFVEFDIPSGPTLYYTPSARSSIIFQSNTYKSLALSVSGIGATSNAFKNAEMQVNNGDKELLPYLQQYDDMRETKVRFFMSFEHLLNSGQFMNESFYRIGQASFNNEVIGFELVHPLNQDPPIPSRLMTREDFPSIGK